MKTSCRSLELLRQATIRNNTLACCGLDPDVEKLPMELRREGLDEDSVRRFLEIVIDLTAPHICCYKVQKAFFDIFSGGHELLKHTINYVHVHHPELPVFVDAKIGDVGNTMDIYLRNIFGELNADGVVVNPYLGDDVMRPFAELPDKAAIVTVKTSNPDAAIVQDVILQDGKPLWKYILELTANRWNGAGNMVPVIGSTADIDLSDVRQIIPDEMPVLFAGYGVQGGTMKHLRQLLDSKRRGVFVNSSRGILYPYDIQDPLWRGAILRAIKLMQNVLNFEKSRSKFLLLLGVSGVGKSTIIRELRKLDDRFVYISPFMTRELRAGEAGKVPITGEQMNEMERQGKLLVVNELYGVRYATPREPIEQAFREEKFPLLDWPIDRLHVMQQAFPNRLFTVYIDPPDTETLRRRLADGRDPDEKRMDAATAELATLAQGTYDDAINHRMVSSEGEAASVANAIYREYIRAMDL
ncbi:MAG TPA: orotidine-5'-phosphate decarboxylase [Candidatus Paceibacterota bacterium]|nr:orotidine-5'-phosphate decarboxylase [Candidatus Paceibacterota bacterium]